MNQLLPSNLYKLMQTQVSSNIDELIHHSIQSITFPVIKLTCLPTPAEVLALSGNGQTKPQPPPVIFEHLNLLVKFGRYVTLAEAQCLWIIREDLGDEVPVPEIYGWRVDGDHDFMDDSDKTSVCEQLSKIISSLRSVEQDPQDSFVGSLNRSHLLDIVFENQPPGGPFATTKQFHDYFSSLSWLRLTLPENFKDPWREYLPDDGSIQLTHGDLHRGNIVVSPTTPPRVLAIIDWAHCGCYPDYWGYCKAAYTCLGA
ncbi:hypothetical protein BPAE_0169g00260 [Botrytis paeoniae]|uniref:Aminoglycoside phosphotransferase domain-containing protein n=1 Tax=Botrytis paeoniae TaxID=278948 RepID=A0A4Z1FGL8_9HELO|nr:hypothetical protein BPAE_0169g00260 [Botrytis paeoniae]